MLTGLNPTYYRWENKCAKITERFRTFDLTLTIKPSMFAEKQTIAGAAIADSNEPLLLDDSGGGGGEIARAGASFHLPNHTHYVHFVPGRLSNPLSLCWNQTIQKILHFSFEKLTGLVWLDAMTHHITKF